MAKYVTNMCKVYTHKLSHIFEWYLAQIMNEILEFYVENPKTLLLQSMELYERMLENRLSP